MFRIDLLPAENGDCLWIEYGSAADPHRVIIDGGTTRSYPALRSRILNLNLKQPQIELLVITHVDLDHIGGAVKLLQDRELRVRYDDIWFNGYRHLVQAADMLGPVDGEKLTLEIVTQKLAWNGAFNGGAVLTPVNGPPATRTLPGGLVLTLLSPTPTQLDALKPKWEKSVIDAGLVPGLVGTGLPDETAGAPSDMLGDEDDLDVWANKPFKCDSAEPNGSSIALLAEYEGVRILLAGDAHPDVLVASLARMPGVKNGRLPVDAMKVPHHGSRNNVSKELARGFDCRRYLFSTNGAGSKHPHREAVARLVCYGTKNPELVFNYVGETIDPWASEKLRRRYGIEARRPFDGRGGMSVMLHE